MMEGQQGIFLIGVLVVLIAIGLPIAFAMALSALCFVTVFPMGPLIVMPQRMTNGIDSFVLMAVPFFVLVGELMNTGGITNRIFKFANDLVGHFKCGLGYVNVLASMVFSGMSGSAVADASGLGAVEMRAMEEAGYDRSFSAAVTAASSTIGPLVPPSIPFVIYGSVTGVSIGRLLLAGAVPGVMLGGLFLLLLFGLSRFRAFPHDAEARFRLRAVVRDFWDAFPALMTPVILVGGIVAGLFTPTEASAIASFYALVLGRYIYRELTWKEAARAFVRAAMTSSQIMFIIAAAAFFGLVLAKAQIPQAVFGSFMSLYEQTNIYVVLVVINLALIAAGCVIDTNPILIIIVPILAPIAVQLGIDPVHFGVIVVYNIMIALLTPPVGMVTFTICRVANCRIDTYTVALLPFLGVMIVGLLLITFYPPISVFLPNLVMGPSN
jgi:tripartite ATP-independent transporter DctM subunit